MSSIGNRAKLYQYIGARVKLRRSFLQLSQHDVAQKITTTVAIIKRIESGTLRPPSWFMRRYAKLCNVPVTWFFKTTPPQDGSGKPRADGGEVATIVALKKHSLQTPPDTPYKRAA